VKRIENVWKCRACGRTSEKIEAKNKQYRQRRKCPHCGSEDLHDAVIIKGGTEGKEVTMEKASWVNVTVTGDPQLARKVKVFLGLMLDWDIFNEAQVLKKEVRQYLKLYDQTTALKSTDRVQFYVVEQLERLKDDKAGFRFEEKRG